MINPFLNLVEMLTNPIYSQSHQQQSLHSSIQHSELKMPIWPINHSIPNYPQQPYIPYFPHQDEKEMQSFLLLSNLLQQSQYFPTREFKLNQNLIQLNQEIQPQSLNSIYTQQKGNDDQKEDTAKKIIFNPIIKKIGKSTPTIKNNNMAISLEEEINNEVVKGNLLENKIRYYRCTFKDCDKVFPKECNLKDHIRTHTGEKPYQCLFAGCGKSFSQHGNLKKHEKVHVGDKKFFCDYPNCGKKFSASYNLKIHYRCHTGEKPYKCNFKNCNRSFYDKGNLKYHEKTMHMAESIEFPYSCEHIGCNVKFQSKKEKLSHHNEKEPDCLIERKELIKLIQKYKALLKYIVKENNIDERENVVLAHLKSDYEEIEGKLIDVEYFKQLLGESFEDECSYVENIKDEEKKTDQASSKNE